MFLEANDPDKKASYTGACDGSEEENGKYDGSWLDKYIPQMSIKERRLNVMQINLLQAQNRGSQTKSQGDDIKH